MNNTYPTPSDLKAFRIGADLTQTEAGALVGAALRTWQSWEAGDRKMPAPKWELFCMKVIARNFPNGA